MQASGVQRGGGSGNDRDKRGRTARFLGHAERSDIDDGDLGRGREGVTGRNWNNHTDGTRKIRHGWENGDKGTTGGDRRPVPLLVGGDENFGGETPAGKQTAMGSSVYSTIFALGGNKPKGFTEDAMVYAFQKTDELRTKFPIDLNEEQALLRLERDRVIDLKLRLHRAEAYEDMTKESCCDLCIGATLKRKREDKDWDGRGDRRWPGLPYK
jgi:hypothetical protein